MKRKKTAVIIDDLELFRTLMTEILEERGYQVSSFATLHDFGCFRQCRCHGNTDAAPLDLLLTGNRLYPISGLELVEKLQTNNCQQLAQNRAILSGSWTWEEKTKAQQLGCQPFEKPFSLESIQDWLDSCENDDHSPSRSNPKEAESSSPGSTISGFSAPRGE